MKQKLDEKENKDIVDGFYKHANEVRTPDQLASFVKGMLGEYHHDYGTIVHACAAAALAACRTVDRDPDSGGITGFQAGCVMWSFVEHWLHTKGPMKLMQYRNMLYPQYETSFAKTITKDTWKWLQAEAKKELIEFPQGEGPGGDYRNTIRDHLQSIAEGEPPFGYRVVDRE